MDLKIETDQMGNLGFEMLPAHPASYPNRAPRCAVRVIGSATWAGPVGLGLCREVICTSGPDLGKGLFFFPQPRGRPPLSALLSPIRKRDGEKRKRSRERMDNIWVVLIFFYI